MRWFIRLVKRCEHEAKAAAKFTTDYMSILFSRYWSHTARHYSSMECAPACPCKAEDMNENIEGAAIVDDDDYSSPEFIEDEEDALDWACVTDATASIPDCVQHGDVQKTWKRCEKYCVFVSVSKDHVEDSCT